MPPTITTHPPRFATAEAVARIAAASRRTQQPQSRGDLVSLAMGEPDFDTLQSVTEAAHASLRSGRTHYSPLLGEPALREALAEKLAATAGAPVDAADILITQGGTAGLAASILGIVNPGDKVVIPTISVDGLRDRTVYCQTFSKSYAMTGRRVGYLWGPPQLLQASARIPGPARLLRRPHLPPHRPERHLPHPVVGRPHRDGGRWPRPLGSCPRSTARPIFATSRARGAWCGGQAESYRRPSSGSAWPRSFPWTALLVVPRRDDRVRGTWPGCPGADQGLPACYCLGPATA